jgi:Zn-finger protein
LKELLRKSDIDELSDKDQIEFYRKHFQYQHCEFYDCGREVGDTWVLDDCELFCEDCFEVYTQQKRGEAENDVERLEKELEKAKQRLNELS